MNSLLLTNSVGTNALDELEQPPVTAIWYKEYKYFNYQPVEWTKLYKQQLDYVAKDITLWNTAVSNYVIDWETNSSGTGDSYYYGDETNPLSYYQLQQYWAAPLKTPQERMREILNKRSMPTLILSTRKLSSASDVREIRARQTLRKIVGEASYRRFLKDGFVSIMNPTSKKVYCIYPGAGMEALTKVYDKGKLLERLCVHLDGNFPPTDHMIVRCLLVLNNENRLWELANKHGIRFANPPADLLVRAQHRPLVELFKELKGGSYQAAEQATLAQQVSDQVQQMSEQLSLAEEQAFANQNYDTIALAA